MSKGPGVNREVPKFVASGTIERIAAEIRDLADQAPGSYEVDIEALANAYDCDIEYVQFDPSSVSARVTRRPGPDGRPFLIEVNASQARARQRFSIAHELAHVVLHDDGSDFDFVEHRMALSDYKDQDRLRKEVQANMLAAALLMPQELVSDFWRRSPDLDDLARQFGVSKDAAYWRVHNLHLLADD